MIIPNAVAINAATTPTKATNMTKPANDSMNPATARPAGRLNSPKKENISPNSHIIHPSTGIHETNNAMSANTKPAVPKPLVRCRSLIIIVRAVVPSEDVV